MLLVTDVHYFEDRGARAAGVLLQAWRSASSREEITHHVADVEPYVSGAFYRRELPCLLALLGGVRVRLAAIVVDGHAWLGEEPGLGAHLHDATGVPVVGIGKNPHASAGPREVLRGGSKNPLFVSAAGYPLADACRAVAEMAGAYRIPQMVKRADRLARDGE